MYLLRILMYLPVCLLQLTLYLPLIILIVFDPLWISMIAVSLVSVGATFVVDHGSALEVLVVVFDVDVSLGVSVACGVISVAVHLTRVLKLADLLHLFFPQM